MKMKKRAEHATDHHHLMNDPPPRSLRAQVAWLRSHNRAEHAHMAERERASRAAFVHRIHVEVTQRIVPEVAQLRATFRGELADMAEQQRLARARFIRQIREWLG